MRLGLPKAHEVLESGGWEELRDLCRAGVIPADWEPKGFGLRLAHLAARDDTECVLLGELISNNPECVKLVANCGWEPLHYAAFAGNLRAIEMLLDAGANIEAVVRKSWFPAEPMKPRETPLRLTGQANRIESARLLLARGADPSVFFTPGGELWSVLESRPEIAQMVLAARAESQMREACTETPSRRSAPGL